MKRNEIIGFIIGVCIFIILLLYSLLAMHNEPPQSNRNDELLSNEMREHRFYEVQTFLQQQSKEKLLMIIEALLADQDEVYFIMQDKEDYNRIKAFDWKEDEIENWIVNRHIVSLFRAGHLESVDYQGKNIIAFTLGGQGNVVSSIDYGLYYSPDDVPLWINAEQLKLDGKCGEFLYKPMLQENDGWIPDKSIISGIQNALLEDYYCYTQRIDKNWYYFESGY